MLHKDSENSKSVYAMCPKPCPNFTQIQTLTHQPAYSSCNLNISEAWPVDKFPIFGSEASGPKPLDELLCFLAGNFATFAYTQ